MAPSLKLPSLQRAEGTVTAVDRQDLRSVTVMDDLVGLREVHEQAEGPRPGTPARARPVTCHVLDHVPRDGSGEPEPLIGLAQERTTP